MPKPESASASAQTTPATPASGRLKRQTAVEMVVDELRTRVLSGRLGPGAVLRQDALADELGVSRIPLREAIRLLSTEGLLDIVPHRGAFVSMLSNAEVRELFDLRLRLEPWLLGEAVKSLASAELDRAEQLIARMDHASIDEWGRLNRDFHELLYQAADRPMTLNIVRALHDKSERYFRFQVVNAPIREQAHEEHANLVSLCRRRRAAEARAALARHISGAAQQIIEIVSRLLDEAGVRSGASRTVRRPMRSTSAR